MCGIGLTLFPIRSLAINDHSSTANFCNNCNIQYSDTDHSNNNSNHHEEDNHPSTNNKNNHHSQGLVIQQGNFCSCNDMNCRSCKDQILHQSLSSRGPDYQSSLLFRQERCLSLSSSSSSSSWDMNLYASVLHMRGKELVGQPYSRKNDNGDRRCYCLCWNGECYSHDAMYGQPWMDVGSSSSSSSSSSSVGEKSIERMTKDETFLENGEDCKDDYRNQMSDTIIVMNLIQQALEEEVDRENGGGDLLGSHHERLCTIMGRIHGEYSFLLYCPSTSNSSTDRNRDCDGTPAPPPPPPPPTTTTTGGVIYFGRDPLGRRSLVMGTTTTKEDHQGDDSSKGKSIVTSLILSSVVPQLGGEGGVHHGNTDKSVVMMGMGNDDMLFEELPAGRVYRLDVFTGELTFLPIVVSQQTLPSQQLSCIGKPQIPLLPSWVVEDEDIPYPILQAAERLYQHLNHAVRRRVMDAPIIIRTKEAIHQNQKQASSVAVLFSGGVDSVVLAALCHNHVPLDQPIDLINVAFASSECHGARKVVDPFSLSPDRQAALLSYQEMKCQWPNRHWRFIAVNVDYETVLEMEDTICKLISPLTSTMDFNIGTAMWFASRGLGEIVDYDNGENDLWKTQMLKESKHLRFCQKSSSASNKNGKSSDSFGPCMTRGCKRLAERDRCRFGVCKVCCSSIFQRRINQYLGGRSDFCHYHSEMAKSVKSKGKKKTSVQENVSKSSKVKQKKNKTETPSSDQVSHVQKEEKLLYQSCAKVVIVGIGADEQMAGYGRHRAIYNKGGYEALRQELAMEKSRLWTRNLGRDDRCISNHGKEARFPFLDDDVTAYLNSLDITEMVDMTKPQGMGDKMILRLVAKRLGVTQCSGLVKRAIQFGSRIAKCSEVDRFGSSRNASGSAKHIRGKTTAVD